MLEYPVRAAEGACEAQSSTVASRFDGWEVDIDFSDYARYVDSLIIADATTFEPIWNLECGELPPGNLLFTNRTFKSFGRILEDVERSVHVIVLVTIIKVPLDEGTGVARDGEGQNCSDGSETHGE